MAKLRLASDLALPEETVTSTMVVYGGKGMGKTNLGSVIVEELTKAGLRWCLLDPIGVSWGLRYSKDGKGPGVECVILGGAHGDIPIEPTGGAIVADLVIDEHVNTIVDFSRRANGEMWSIGEKVRFVTEYTHRLFRRQGELVDGKRREPLMQILDEAARYIPQVIPSGAIDLAKCVGAWEQVCEEGRNIGLGVTFLTQRSARMNKSVSELADVMFAFRTIGPNSLSAIMDWLGEHVEKSRIRDLAAQVRELDVGTALVVSPGWLRTEKVVHIRERETFDSSATPKAGERSHRVSGRGAQPDLAKYRDKMAATIEKAKADDPKELRKRITELERAAKLPASKPAPIDASAIERAAQRARDEERQRQQRALRTFVATVQNAGKALVRINDAVRGALELLDGAVLEAERGWTGVTPTKIVGSPVDRVITVNVTRPPSPRVSSHNGTNGRSQDNGLKKGQQRILDALAELDALGYGETNRTQLGMFAGYNLTGGSGAQHIADLIDLGLVEIPGAGAVRLTSAGHAAADSIAVPSTLGELHARVHAKLSTGQQRILAHLIDIWPEEISRADLGKAVNYNLTGGSGAQHVADLINAGAAKIPGSGKVIASEFLFPDGLR